MDISNFQYNPTVEKIVNILQVKSQNYDPHFFRLQTNFFLALVPSVMHIQIDCELTGLIPINVYGISLMPSGTGKGFSTNILEEKVLGHFKKEFLENVMPERATLSLDQKASIKSANTGISRDLALQQVTKEYESYGNYVFSSDSGSIPAIKQLRSRILMARSGSINIMIDEIGLNLSNSTDALTALLELYDKGLIRTKLLKNTDTSVRYEELSGSSPTNLLMFGSPSKLLNGGKIESDFFDFLETGYARRSFFSYSKPKKQASNLTPEELYDLQTQGNHDTDLIKLARDLHVLANVQYVGSHLKVSRNIGVMLMQYRSFCDQRALELSEFEDIQASELKHRYFKALKLAGVYAFIDGKSDIEQSHLEQAIRFTEDSGEALDRMFNREKNYEKLARYIADNTSKELTSPELETAFSFYKGSLSHKNELITMAVAWGYKNNIIIKRYKRDDVEFITGETLKQTDINDLIISYSDHIASGYINTNEVLEDGSVVPKIGINNISDLLTASNYHWINHYSIDGNRKSTSMSEEFNTIVLDIDNGISLEKIKTLMKDYTFIMHTTKRHLVPNAEGEVKERCRLILPMNYHLKLTREEYKEFMLNVAKWLPFGGLDEGTYQPERKWSCYENAEITINNSDETQLIDITPFIPQTKRNDEYKKQIVNTENLGNLERWFLTKMEEGNRNNNLASYALMLIDTGLDGDTIKSKVVDLNKKLSKPLLKEELDNTIFKTIDSKVSPY